MDRRRFIALFGSTAAVLPCTSYAKLPKKVYRIGLVGGAFPQAAIRKLTVTHAFIDGMRELGYHEGENVQFEARSAEGKITERAGAIAEELTTNGMR